MIYAPTVIGVVTLVAILVFFWRRSGLGSGRAFGNKIAAHIGIQRSLFYSILDHGTKDSSRELLASLAKSKYSAEAASVELGPTLVKGIEPHESLRWQGDAKVRTLKARLFWFEPPFCKLSFPHR